jgi:hypothetical protein
MIHFFTFFKMRRLIGKGSKTLKNAKNDRGIFNYLIVVYVSAIKTL